MRSRCLLLAVVAVASEAANGQVAARPDSIGVAVVTYVSGMSVYIDAGHAAGLREGARLEIIRGGAMLATATVRFLSSRSAAAEFAADGPRPAAGDSVRYHVRVDAAPSTTAAPSTSAARVPHTRRPPPVRGMVGVRLFRSEQVAQPAMDIRLSAPRIGNAPVRFALDVRSRRSSGATTNGVRIPATTHTRVHEASLAWARDSGRMRVSAGRQYSAAFAPVSLFDGVLAEVAGGRWSAGAFAGVQPDEGTLGFSPAVREQGAFVRAHSADRLAVPWAVTVGGVSSSAGSAVNRDFGFAHITINTRSLTLFATQEVDVNRGWKRTAGEPAFGLTSTFITAHVRPPGPFSLNGGMDSRRNVRLYRDHVNAETQFDDAVRRGWWAGTDLSLPGRVRIGGDVRGNGGGPALRTFYSTAFASVSRLSPAHIDARLRYTRFSTDRSRGLLRTWSVAGDPFGMARLEISGGARHQHTSVTTPDSGEAAPVIPNAVWVGASTEVSIGRHWYVVLSMTDERSGSARSRQSYGSLLFRF